MKNLELPIWDLTDFYPSSDSKEFKDDISLLDSEVVNFCKKYKGKISRVETKKIDKVVSEYEKIEELIVKIKSYIFLFHCTDQLDPKKTIFYQKTQEKVNQIESKLIFFTLEINKLNQTKLNKSFKSKYLSWINIQRQFKKYQKNESIEKLLIDKSTTSSNAWIRLFDETMARLRFDFNGKKLNETEVLDLLSSSDASKREQAARVFGKTLKDNIHLFSIITNTLSKDLQIENSLRGFKSCDSSRHLSNQVDPEDVDCLVKTVKKNYADLSHRYYKYKAKVFNVKRLNFWDRNAPYPKQKSQNISWKTAKEIVEKAYKDFDVKVYDIIKLFFSNSWIHAPVSNGKMSGAFAHPATPSLHPYILINYQNKVRDVMTLAHELGHGVHQYLANDKGLLLSDTPLTLAETASVFGEMLTFKSILKKANTDLQKKNILRSKIEDMLNTVIRQIAFYEFEKEVHTQRNNGELSVDEINSIWLKTQKESFGESIKISGDYKYFWAYIPHFIHSPFYVYAYAFGDCLVNSLYAKYESGDKNFNEKYIEMLRSGGARNYKELLKEFDLNPKDPQFWQSGLNIIKKLIDDLEQLV